MITYKVSMTGAMLADPYTLLRAVFPQWNGEPANANSGYVTVTFDSPQTPATVGPLVLVDVFDSYAPQLP
jgi:hypothetical protein